MIRVIQDDDEVQLVAGPLHLIFTWDGHRWAHRLAMAREAGQPEVAAASLEWAADDADPSRIVSPSYQQISTQEDSVARALLVGLWGVHHFSGVFALEAQAEGATIDVDVAVRSRGVVASLAGTYALRLSSADLASAEGSSVEWTLGEGGSGGRLRFESVEPDARLVLAEAGRLATHLQVMRAVDPSQRSHRLRYRWRWFRSAGV